MSAATQPKLEDHLRELRGRLLSSVGVVGLGGGVGYVFRGAIIAFLQRPLNEPLYYNSPTGSFEFVMQVCLLVGLLIALPVLLYNVLRFVEPALPRRFTRLQLSLVISASFGLALGGAAFGYYVSLPAAFRFFGSVGTNHLHALISVDQYFRFVVTYLGMFAVIFQLPLILLLVDSIKPMGPKGLRRWRKFVFVGAFAIAIITPSAPDPLSQVILALPMIVLYELTIVGLALKHRRRTRSARVAAAPSAAPMSVTALAPARLSIRQPLIPASHRGRGVLDLRRPAGPPPSLPHLLDLRSAS